MVAAVLVVTVAIHHIGVVTDPERLRVILAELGPFAPLAIVELLAAQVLVATAGYLYRDRLPVVGNGTAEHHSRLPKRNR